MSHLPLLLLSIAVYALAARFALSLTNAEHRSRLFAAVNIAGLGWLSLMTTVKADEYTHRSILSLGTDAIALHLLLVGAYILAIVVAWFLLLTFAARGRAYPWIAFFYPIALLVAFRYLRFIWHPMLARAGWEDWVVDAAIIGLSYMAFRLSYLVLEVRNGQVPSPSLCEYLGFAFFVPVMVVGPINPYATHYQSITAETKPNFPLATSIMRIVVGATKFLFLANLANQLTYGAIFSDGKPHVIIDLAVAVIFYYLYLFCNFSGFCDMAIGLAAIVGVRVRENFDNPFVARNVKEFWNRWHITLSEYTRDVVFAPVSKTLIRKLGPKYANLAISVGIVFVFLTIGIWHGIGRHYIYFGLLHAAAVITNHYYTIFMKKALGKQRYKAYNENPVVNAIAMIMTFLYVACAFALFANTIEKLGEIRNALAAGGWQLY